jgi:hypothetical protein
MWPNNYTDNKNQENMRFAELQGYQGSREGDLKCHAHSSYLERKVNKVLA